MSIDLTASVTLSPDQQEAADACLESLAAGNETVLVGAAGTGKTTLTRYIIEQFGRHTVIGCPTGKAAQRAQQVTGVRASTIHQLLYQKVDTVNGELLFSEPRKPCSKRDLLIIDEASMLGSKLYKELMEWLPEGAPILFVGDREQLPPVRDTWGPDLLNPTGCLTQVHRQAAGNPIISLATAIRNGEGRQWLREWDGSNDAVQLYDGSPKAIEWHLRRKIDEKDSTLITFTHDIRRWANAACREVMEYDKQGPVVPGDRILIKANSRKVGVMNGDILDVTKVEQMRKPIWYRVYSKQRLKPVMVNSVLIEGQSRDYWQWYNALPNKLRFGMPFVHTWRGECITTHSAQGSSWSEVGFLWGHHVRQRMNSRRKADREFARRFLYTAVTRAEEKLAIFAV